MPLPKGKKPKKVGQTHRQRKKEGWDCCLSKKIRRNRVAWESASADQEKREGRKGAKVESGASTGREKQKNMKDSRENPP